MSNHMWPQLLAKYDIADTLRATAYENAHARERACLKNAMAFHALQGEGPHCEHIQRNFANRGYWLNVKTQPVPWVLCICSAGYASPARLIAALMPAIMAGVPDIYVLYLDENPSPALLLALELMGLEQAVAVPKADSPLDLAREFLINLAPQCGRVLLLSDISSEMSSLYKQADELRIPWWQDSIPPRIVTHNLLEAEQALLNFAQPDAILSEHMDVSVDAIYGDKLDAVADIFIPQVWAKGMEGCFIHRHLSVEFFQNSALMAGNFVQDDRHEYGQ